VSRSRYRPRFRRLRHEWDERDRCDGRRQCLLKLALDPWDGERMRGRRMSRAKRSMVIWHRYQVASSVLTALLSTAPPRRWDWDRGKSFPVSNDWTYKMLRLFDDRARHQGLHQMSYTLVEESTTRAPKYHTKSVTITRGIRQHEAEVSTKEPTGGYVETVHKIWRCSLCRALFVGSSPPKVCGKCHA
jgi:hypothetical protein